MTMMKTLIWAWPTRIFHGLLAVSFVAAYLSGEEDDWIHHHFAFGAFVGVLLFLRLVYGIIGPKYSHFISFPMGIRQQIEFLKTYFSTAKAFPGHNPVAALVMLAIFVIGFLCSLSGFGLYLCASQKWGVNAHTLGEIHEVLANLFLLLVALHLTGVCSDLIFHSKIGTFQSIFTGNKTIQAEDVRLNGLQKVFSVVWLTLPFLFFYLAYGLQYTKSEHRDRGQKKTEQHEKDDED